MSLQFRLRPSPTLFAWKGIALAKSSFVSGGDPDPSASKINFLNPFAGVDLSCVEGCLAESENDLMYPVMNWPALCAAVSPFGPRPFRRTRSTVQITLSRRPSTKRNFLVLIH